jgi:chemotaxis protein histidine kinase CheA
MTAPGTGSYLDFFVLEAGEYVEQIDGVLLRATASGPDADQLQRISRALRGSATMARLPMFAELSSAVEAIGRGLRQGGVAWNEALKGALTSAVDDLKILVRAARSWSAAEDEWALKRLNDLSKFVQVPLTAAPASTATPPLSTSYFIAETANIAAGLELLATRPDDKANGLNVLARVRAMRGVSGVRDVPGLSEASEAAEAAIRPMEMGEPRLSDERVNVLRAASELLRVISTGLSTGETVTTTTPQYTQFLAALDAMLADVAGADRVIAISDLFYNDRGPHVVFAAPNPPTTPAQRFRMEVVSLGEHLHRVIDEARAAKDEIQREHARGELGRALRAIRATAASFGQMAVAQTVEAYLERTGNLNVSALDAIASFATTISPAATAPTPVAQANAIPSSRQTMPRSAIGTPTTPPPFAAQEQHEAGTPSSDQRARVMAAVPTPPTPVPPAPARPPKSLKSVAISLDSTIAAFESMSNERLAEPVDIGDEVLPVDALLYRGRAALDRALEIRDEIRRSNAPPTPELLEELYDLVELARVD